jgi:hypothetical protein
MVLMNTFMRFRLARVFCLSLLFGCSRLFAQSTEAPGTVAPGEWLGEFDVAGVIFDRSTPAGDGVKTRQVSLASSLFTRGIAPKLDAQIGFDVWVDQHTHGADTSQCSGQGDAQLRLKWTFTGRDAESAPGKDDACFCAALLPYVRLPLSRRGMGAHTLEPGLLMPFSTPLAGGNTFGGMAGLEFIGKESGGLERYWSASCYVAHPLSSMLSAYVEMTSNILGSRPRLCTLTGAVGLTWQATDKLLWEFAVYAGLNRAAADFNPVLRLSYGF